MIQNLPTAVATALQQHLRHNKTDLSGLYVHMIASCAGILVLSQGCCGVTLFAVSLDQRRKSHLCTTQTPKRLRHPNNYLVIAMG